MNPSPKLRSSSAPLGQGYYFARLAAPHPLEPERCPRTRYLNSVDADPEVESWHARQHLAGNAPTSCRLLIHWLTGRSRTPTGSRACSG